MFWVFVSCGLFSVNDFVDFRYEKCCFNVEVVGVEFIPSGIGEKETDRRGLGNWGEGVVIVLSWDLGKATSYPSRFVEWFCSFRILDSEYEFCGDNVVVLWS